MADFGQGGSGESKSSLDIRSPVLAIGESRDMEVKWLGL
jgi:hypothetical protein